MVSGGVVPGVVTVGGAGPSGVVDGSAASVGVTFGEAEMRGVVDETAVPVGVADGEDVGGPPPHAVRLAKSTPVKISETNPRIGVITSCY